MAKNYNSELGDITMCREACILSRVGNSTTVRNPSRRVSFLPSRSCAFLSNENRYAISGHHFLRGRDDSMHTAKQDKIFSRHVNGKPLSGAKQF